MDQSQFDELAARLAARLNRRRSLAVIAGVGLPAAVIEATKAGKKKKKKKVTLCFKGQTVTVPKKSVASLIRQGATQGSCRSTTSSPNDCPAGRKACGNRCIPNSNCCADRDCGSGFGCEAGLCVATTAPPPPQCGNDGFCTVFVTSGTFTGAQVNGLAGADQLCQSAADTAGVDGVYKAWISAGSQSPETRFTASTIASGGPWRLQPNVVDGVNLPPVVATNFADLLSCTTNCLQHAIDRTELGDIAAASVWTGTFSDGDVSTDTCAGWTSNNISNSGLFGNASAIDPTWTGSRTSTVVFGCNTSFSLYCFEQSV
ncbi:MAG: DUF1554 domain-containing protein [Thermomicrobiales bacterium]